MAFSLLAKLLITGKYDEQGNILLAVKSINTFFFQFYQIAFNKNLNIIKIA